MKQYVILIGLVFALGFIGTSFATPDPNDLVIPTMVLSHDVLAPLKQHASGTYVENVQCKDDLLLVIKADFVSSACVKFTTVAKLFERGWTFQEVPIIHESLNKSKIRIIGTVDRVFSVEGIEFHLIPIEGEQDVIKHTGFDKIIMYSSEDTISLFTRFIDDKEIQVQGIFLSDTHDAHKENFSGLPIFVVQELTIRESELKTSELVDNEHYPVDPLDIINANNQFALDFYSKTSQNNNKNIFFSPTSISTAFSILYEGAREDTAVEIQKVFGFPENELERKHGNLSLHNFINEKSNDETQLEIANALWLARNFKPLPEYIDTATTYYDSTVNTVDFVSHDGVNKINDWVKTKTNDKIKDILKPGSTDSNTRMAITNAIYFNGLWHYPFDSEDTYEGDFKINSEKTVKVPMMTYPHKMQINHVATERMQMLEMPYKDNIFSMLIILPNDVNDLKSVEDSITKENLAIWKEKSTEINRGIPIHIPKFTLETNYDLEKILPEMGMPSVFSSTTSDLSGITDYKGLFVSQAIHKAFVDVTEEGTEAAGATVIVTDESGGPMFRADHPFIFIIQENETDQILFMGRVMDPIN